jgi:hypothetical protein
MINTNTTACPALMLSYASPSRLLSTKRRNRDKITFKRSWDEVMELLGICQIVQGNVFPRTDIPDLTSVVTRVLKTWEERSFLMNFPGNNENECQFYAMDLVISTMLPTCRNLAIRLQYPGKDEEYGGPMDISIYAKTPSKMPVMHIVEAKKNDFNQGRAQLYPQLKVCYQLANAKEEWGHPIYGAISTVREWIFVKYDGVEWIEAECLQIATYRDRIGIQKVAEALFKTLDLQNQQVEHVVFKYKV